MDRFESVRAIVDTYIKANGNEEITGEVLNNVLNAMLDDISNAINGTNVGGGNNSTSIVVDTMLSDTSVNPVQNKAVKAYVDDADSAIDERIVSLAGRVSNLESQEFAIDDAMSDTSVRPVQNKAIKTYIDDAVANVGAEAVIFDATSSSDPWNLNVLQTSTTIEEMTEAINNGSPIYMRFGSGLVAVANAELYQNGDVSLYAHLVDSESEIIRTIHTYSTDGGWTWESTDNPMGGGGEVDSSMSDTSVNPVQNKVVKAYVDQFVYDVDYNAGVSDDYATINVDKKNVSGKKFIGLGVGLILQNDIENAAEDDLDNGIFNNGLVTALAVKQYVENALKQLASGVTNLQIDFTALNELVDRSPLIMDSEVASVGLTSEVIANILTAKFNKVVDANVLDVWNYTAYKSEDNIHIQFMQGDGYDIYNSYSLWRNPTSGYWTIIYNEI